uniref:Pentatricopeptide repeat-containing protein-mitochondrial domain-containing protein n=1 Tax=Globisporangium ultimum (strain ATCC 200006 / CBS 805.95 / DAOM BR144) TaxID=431595 RepID=K3WYE7_GLOUD
MFASNFSSSAKQSLINLGKKVESSSAKVDGESDYQKAKRLQKAMTGPLDKFLYHCRQRKDYKQIEGIAYVWDDVFPQFASNMKHRTIICENYAFVLNYQQRFGDVIDNLFKKQLSVRTNGGESVNYKALMMSSQLAESILLACGHLKDTESAVRLLEIMRLKNVRITKVAYFHLLNTLLKDEENVNLGLVLQLCEEVVHDLNDTVPMSLLPTVIKVAAEHDELDRAMNVYNHPIDAPMDSFTEFRFEICLQCLCNHGYISAMMEIYNNVMKSSTATRGLKERLSKCLLLKCLKDRKTEHHEAVAEVALDILEIMEEHQIETNHHTVYPLIRTLLLGKYITTGDDLIAFFSKYSHVIELNSFSICEAVIACVFCKDVQLVDKLFVHALDNNIPIKYAALEKVVSFYYKLGMLGDLEKVADIIRALRLNKHIPLGIAVTEIGMASNIRLGRYEEVIHLFEDFSAMDGERKRILKRRIMLKSALKAYAALNRLDESNAIKVLLGNSYGNVLKRTSESADGVEDNGDDDEDFSDFFTESIDKKIDDRNP